MAVVGQIKQFDILLVALDPAAGSEMQKTRPCLVVSPDEMNRYLRTVIVAPMTTGGQPYPSRVAIRFRNKNGRVALDQIRAVDKERFVQRLGTASRSTAATIANTLVEMFTLAPQ